MAAPWKTSWSAKPVSSRRDEDDDDKLITEEDLQAARKAYQGKVGQANALGIDGDGASKKGLGNWLMDGLGALDKMRAVTFAAGEELLSIGDDGPSLKNFRENVANHKGFGDTELLKMDKDDAIWERALKGVGAFVGDVATDPLTYITPGSIMGRKGGARAAAQLTGKKAAQVVAAASDDVAEKFALGMADEMMAKRLAKLTGESAEELAAEGRDHMLKVARQHGVVRELAEYGVANVVGEAYALRSSRGLREVLDEKTFGQLPAELQGGLTVRVPFKRALNEAGEKTAVPWAKSVGVGKLDGIPGVERMADLGLTGRAYLRSTKAGKLVNWGADGADYHTMVAQALRGAEPLGVGWSKYAAKQGARKAGDKAARTYTKNIEAALRVSRYTLDHAPDTELAEKHAAEFFSDRAALRAALADPEADDTVKAAAVAVNEMYEKVIDPLGGRLKQLADRNGWDMGRIEDYVPRLLTDAEREELAAVYKGGRKAGKTKPEQSRTAFVREIEVDPETGEARVASWLSPKEVNDLKGRQVFADDPFLATSEYADIMTRALRRETALDHMAQTGLILKTTDAQAEWFDHGKVAATAAEASHAVRQGIEALRQAGDSSDLKAALKALRQTPERGHLKASKVKNGLWRTEDGVTYRDVRKHPGGGTKQETPGGLFDGDAVGPGSAAFRPPVTKDGRVVRSGWVADLPDGTQAFGRTLAEVEEAAARKLREPRRDAALARQKREALEQLVQDEERLVRALSQEHLPPPGPARDDYYEAVIDAAGRWTRVASKDAHVRVETIKGEAARKLHRSGKGDLTNLASGVNPAVQTRMRDWTAYADQDVKEYLERAYTLRNPSPAVEAFLDGFWAPLMTFFKSTATIGAGPGFIARNVLSGAQNAFLFDVGRKHFAQAGRSLHAMYKAMDGLEEAVHAARLKGDTAVTAESLLEQRMVKQLGKKYGDKEAAEVMQAWKWFHDDGLAVGRTQGELLREYNTGADELRLAQRANDRVQDMGWMRFWGNRNEDAERYLRFATYLKGIEQTGDRAWAREGVWLTQFDYDSTSDAERLFVANAVPFFKWMRGNIPLAFRSAMARPDRLNQLWRGWEQTLKVASEDPNDPAAGSILPEWVEETGGVKTNIGLGNDSMVLRRELPFDELNEWFQAPGRNPLNLFGIADPKEVGGAMNPVATAVVEGLSGVDTFTGAPIQPETYSLPFTDGGPEATVNGDLVNIIRNLNPVANRAERLGGVTDRYEDRLATSWMSALAGAPVMTLNPRQEQGEMLARQRRLQEAIEAKYPNQPELLKVVSAMLEQGASPEEVAAELSRRQE